VETYYSRGVRGARSDVVSLYDPRTLMPQAEIDIPDKRGVNFPTGFNSTLTDDDRFLLVYNFAPAQSVSVVDTVARAFVGEIETPGCALVYPAGPRRFFMLCADGGLLAADLDDAGKAVARRRSAAFFDPNADPIQEDGARIGATWLFASYGGRVYGVDPTGPEPVFAPPWSLLDDGDRREGWRTGGGMQLIALHAGSGRLYVLMNQAGPYGQDDPGSDIWIYHLDRRTRVGRISAAHPISSIVVTPDPQPLLFSVFAGSASLDVYDAASGRFLRTVEPVAASPMILQLPRSGR
jgi:methylamine dehydrogenase heavy chain